MAPYWVWNPTTQQCDAVPIDQARAAEAVEANNRKTAVIAVLVVVGLVAAFLVKR